MNDRGTAMDDARRQKLARTMAEPSELDDVIEAIAAFAKVSNCKVQIEQYGSPLRQFRWAIVHGGGPYPLLREVARFLEVDHHSILVQAKAVDGQSIVAPAQPIGLPTRRGMITPSSDKALVADRILKVFGLYRS